MALQRLLHELQGCGLIPFPGDEGFQNLALVIDGTPKVAHLAVDLDLDLIEVPLPLAGPPHPALALAANVSGEERTKSGPPQPDRPETQIDAALEKQVLDIA